MDFFVGSSGAKASSKGKDEGNLTWWQISLIGIGCTIGTFTAEFLKGKTFWTCI
ncbi:hypothetical protein G6549_11975 [Bacillus sp. MM2020_1]|nr:hypothetical protein [Bacillus sp. MM2020_1]